MDAAEKKPRMPAWVSRLLIWCGPTLAIFLAAVCLFGLVPSMLTLPTFCLIFLAGLIVTRLIFLNRSRRKGAAFAWRAGLWIVVLAVLLFFGLFFPREIHRSTRILAQRRFESMCAEVFPGELSLPLELGTPKSVVCHSYAGSVAIFEWKSRTLLCRYDEADYFEEKAALETRYRFRTEPLSTGKTEPSSAEPTAVIGDDLFRVVLPPDEPDENRHSYNSYYKNSFIVVTNDVRHEIGYLVFEDRDLDEAEDLPWLLQNYCGWDLIR